MPRAPGFRIDEPCVLVCWLSHRTQVESPEGCAEGRIVFVTILQVLPLRPELQSCKSKQQASRAETETDFTPQWYAQGLRYLQRWSSSVLELLAWKTTHPCSIGQCHGDAQSHAYRVIHSAF